jgi:hypothetical protein
MLTGEEVRLHAKRRGVRGAVLCLAIRTINRACGL